MSAGQLDACAARMPEPERDEFLELQARARDLILEAAALRRRAWQLYRDCLCSGGMARWSRRRGGA